MLISSNQNESSLVNKARIYTIIILALLWTIGGIRLIWGGSFLLMGTSATGIWLVLPLILAFAVGAAKGKFVLAKSAQRSIAAAEALEDNNTNRALGWAKAWGLRGFILISVMIALGVFLGSDYSPLNAMWRGLVRIAIGSALLIGSLNFWFNLGENK